LNEEKNIITIPLETFFLLVWKQEWTW
jgi:hypothetical protein